MNHHHTSFVPVATLMSPPAVADDIVKQIAASLIAGVIAAQLDLEDDIDVIETVRNACPQYRCRLILNHLDAAIVECKQTLIAIAMSEETAT